MAQDTGQAHKQTLPQILQTNQSEALREDSRLKQEVTISRQRVYIGELVQILSEQTGISLQADGKDGAADQILTVFADKTPVVDMMNSIWSLLSYNGATYRWVRDGDGKQTPYSYRLIRPEAAQKFPATIRQRIQEDMMRNIEDAVQHVDKSGDELDEVIQKNPIMEYLRDTRMKQALEGMGELTTAEERANLLNGDYRSIKGNLREFAVDKLSPAMKNYVDKEMEFRRSLNPHLQIYSPTNFYLTYKLSGPSLTPNLSVVFGDKQMVSGNTVMGGKLVENRWQDELFDLWTLPGDETASDKEGTKISDAELKEDVGKRPENPSPFEPRLKGSTTGKEALLHLREFHRRTKIPVVARLWEQTFLPDPKGLTIAEFLKPLSRNRQVYKWRDGTLIITYFGHLQRDDLVVPWKAHEFIITERAKDPGRKLSLAAICELMSTLTDDHLKLLDEQYNQKFYTTIIGYRDLFAPIHRRPEVIARLVQGTKVPIGDFPLPSQQYLRTFVAERHLPEYRRSYLRLRIVEPVYSKPIQPDDVACTYLFEILNDAGEVTGSLPRLTWYSAN
jgi:hypothetical protein